MMAGKFASTLGIQSYNVSMKALLPELAIRKAGEESVKSVGTHRRRRIKNSGEVIELGH